MMKRFLTILLMGAALSLTLAACGKKGDPENIPGGNYPTIYPTR